MSIGPTEAIRLAMGYLAETIGSNAQAIRVEEIEADNKVSCWIVTLSFQREPDTAAIDLSAMTGRDIPESPNRSCLRFEISTTSGEVLPVSGTTSSHGNWREGF